MPKGWLLRVFLWGTAPTTCRLFVLKFPVRRSNWERTAKNKSKQKKENTMKKKERIVSYRRRCRNLGNGTGLAHYILLSPNLEKKA